jgi:hypothetical protein
MFTLEQIKQAHDKVQTGADFSIYSINQFGCKGYDLLTMVALPIMTAA